MIESLNKMIEEGTITPLSDYFKIEWLEHLIWCPSQISMRFMYHGQEFELYLRWRHEDPWSFNLIFFPPNSEGDEWFQIDEFPKFSAEEYKRAEEWCEGWLVKQIETKELNKYLIDDGEVL